MPPRFDKLAFGMLSCGQYFSEYKLCGSVILRMIIATMLGCENIPSVAHTTFMKCINRVFHLLSIYCYILLSLPWAFKTEMF